MITFSPGVRKVRVQVCSAAAASLLLGHLLDLLLPPLQDLHALGTVAFSLLSPEPLHILEEPVPATTRERHVREQQRNWRLAQVIILQVNI